MKKIVAAFDIYIAMSLKQPQWADGKLKEVHLYV